MARSGLSKFEVFDVATKLQQQGSEPTIERVRSELGTGSNTTISKYLRDWRALNDSGLLRKEPLDLPSQLLLMAETFWKTAKTHAELETNVFKEEADQKVTKMQETLNVELIKSKEEENKYDELEKKLLQQTEQTQKLIEQLETERQSNAALKAQAAAVEEHLRQQREENNKLHQMSESLQRNWEHLEKTSHERQEKLKYELENIRQHSDHQIKQFTTETQQLSQENQLFQSQIKEIKEHCDQLKFDNLELHKQLERKSFEVNSLQERITQLNEELNNKQQLINDREKMLRAADVEQAKSVTENKKICEEILQIKGKVQFLESKNYELSGEKHNLEGRLQQLQNSLVSRV